MGSGSWQGHDALVRRMRMAGRALLELDLQDSHSGNLALSYHAPDGEPRIAITATGSQKGDLGPDDICHLARDSIDTGYYKASTETEIHAGILAHEGTGASIHAHTKDLTIVTLDDGLATSQPPPFQPVDPLGHHHLEGLVPVARVAVPSGSPEMREVIPRLLEGQPAMVVHTHGTFARGQSLEEALLRISVANASGYIVRWLQRLGVDLDALRHRIREDPRSCFALVPTPYPAVPPEGLEHMTGDEEEEIVAGFRTAGHRMFASRLSPFHTGSLSVRGVDSLLYAPQGAMPRYLPGSLRRLPLAAQPDDSPTLALHKAIYARGHFQTVAHAYVPEAEILAHAPLPGEEWPPERIVAIDAEGSFLYPVVPVTPPDVTKERLISLLHDYKVVIVRGGGVWGVGSQSISEVLHHPSSVREICLYRLGALERGLALTRLEPPRSREW